MSMARSDATTDADLSSRMPRVEHGGATGAADHPGK
jgi:hypothetical protein